MKKLFIAVLLMTCLGSIAFAQKKEKRENIEVPSVVKTSFQKSYPDTHAKWEKEDGKYEASFKKDGQKMSVLFSVSGVLEESEVDISVNQLPASVAKYILQQKLGTIKDASKITKADGSIFYEAEVKSGDVLFDANGNFVKLSKD